MLRIFVAYTDEKIEKNISQKETLWSTDNRENSPFFDIYMYDIYI